MAFYSAYHQEHRNVMIHVVGVPMISFSLLVVLSWVNLFQIGGFSVTLAMVFAAAVVLYYYSLDVIFALAATILFGGLLVAAHYVSFLGATVGWTIFAVAQLSGWSSQFYGHFVFEKSRPALFDNLFQAVVSAPLFVIADVFFELGFRKHLEAQIKQVLKEQGKLKTFGPVTA
jgi:uncharacterized membrane protein YGL010W